MFNIDFREELKVMEKEFSIKVLYLNSNKYIKCKCFNDLYKSGNPKCNLCCGSGRLTTLQLVNTIMYNSTGTSIASELGNMVKDNNVFIFNHKIQLKEKDIVLVVGFKNGFISDLKEMYEVDYVDIVRGDRGRVEYQVCYTNSANRLIKGYANAISQISINNSKKLLQGNKILFGDINGI